MNIFDDCFDQVERTDDTEYTQFGRLYPKYVMALASSAHTYGNILATAEHWILEIFKRIRPAKNGNTLQDTIFKTIHVSSRIAHSQLLQTPQSTIKKAKPMILFSPRIEYGEQLFMDHTLATEKRGGIYTTRTNGVVDLHPFFFDGNNQVSIYHTTTRRCMYVDVMLVFDTMMQQINYFEYLKNQLDWDMPFDIEAWLEAYLSIEMMDMLGEISGIPVHNPHDNTVTDFLNYMNSHSLYPVTYKLAGESGKEEFYKYFKENMIATLTNLDRDQGENINHIMSNYKITFSLRLEFWFPGLMYLMSEKIKSAPDIVPEDTTLIPVFADMFVLEDLNLAPGWQVYGHSSYILEKIGDEVCYSNLIQTRIRELIAEHIEMGIPLDTFIDIKVRRMGNLIREGVDYTVDYLKNIIKFNNDEYGFDTYTVIVSINVLYINEYTKDVNNLE